MEKFSLPLTKLVHENISIIMDFSFSRRPLYQLVDERYVGEWKYLRKALFDYSELRAEKACLELAMFMRIIDDEEDISSYLNQNSNFDFGRLILKDNKEKKLSLRDVCNKIIHASSIQWNFETENKPILICNTRETEKWIKAEIDIVALATYCGNLMS